MTISVAVITYNEEVHIEKCIRSVLSFATEIIIVDSFSTDNTMRIIEQLQQETSTPIRVFSQSFLGHIAQKNMSLAQCKSDYILSLDADEMLDDEAIASIRNSKFNHTGYRFNRLNFIGTKAIKHGSWYPDTKLRFVKKNAAEWIGINPHDKLALHSGDEKMMKGNILHFSYASISELLPRTRNYAEISAQHLFSLGKKATFSKRYINPIARFLKHYLLKQGFLEGKWGWEIGKQQYLEAKWKYELLHTLHTAKKS